MSEFSRSGPFSLEAYKSSPTTLLSFVFTCTNDLDPSSLRLRELAIVHRTTHLIQLQMISDGTEAAGRRQQRIVVWG